MCDGFTVKAVPMGFAVSAPFDWFTGDKVMFYIRQRGDQFRAEDSGATLFDLAGAGVDVDGSQTRRELLLGLCSDVGIDYDEDESIFSTEYVSAKAVGVASLSMLEFLMRVQDMMFLNRAWLERRRDAVHT